MKFFELVLVYFIGLIGAFMTIAVSGIALNHVWSYGMNDITGYEMTLKSAVIITMFMLFIGTIMRSKANDKTYTDVGEAILACISLVLTKILAILLCWFSIWILSFIFV